MNNYKVFFKERDDVLKQLMIRVDILEYYKDIINEVKMKRKNRQIQKKTLNN